MHHVCCSLESWWLEVGRVGDLHVISSRAWGKMRGDLRGRAWERDQGAGDGGRACNWTCQACRCAKDVTWSKVLLCICLPWGTISKICFLKMHCVTFHPYKQLCVTFPPSTPFASSLHHRSFLHHHQCLIPIRHIQVTSHWHTWPQSSISLVPLLVPFVSTKVVLGHQNYSIYVVCLQCLMHICCDIDPRGMIVICRSCGYSISPIHCHW